MLLLLGPTDAGKTTLARRLLQKAGEAFLLDLDPGQGALPGTFSLFLHREGRLLLVRRTLLGTLSPAGAGADAPAARPGGGGPVRQGSAAGRGVD